MFANQIKNENVQLKSQTINSKPKLPAPGSLIYVKNLPNRQPKFIPATVVKIIGSRILEVDTGNRIRRVHLHHVAHKYQTTKSENKAGTDTNDTW